MSSWCSFHPGETFSQTNTTLAANDNKQDKGPECAVCKVDRLPRQKLIKLYCEHFYCADCLPIWLKVAVINESTWPARCCGLEIDLRKVRPYIPISERAHIDKKAYEYSVKDKVYCSNENCATFLGPAEEREPATRILCEACLERVTCMKCKKAAHEGTCQKDSIPVELEELAREMQWQSCPHCQHMIEITYGCNKMQCYCSTLFCYLCKKLWRSCDCRRWVDKQLYFHATRVYLRSDKKEPLPKIVERLRTATNCGHQGLHRTAGAGKCDLCGDFLDKYLYRGCDCGLEVCLWCVTGRLWLHKNTEAPHALLRVGSHHRRIERLRRYFGKFTQIFKKSRPLSMNQLCTRQEREERLKADMARANFRGKQEVMMRELGVLAMDEELKMN